MWLPRFISSAVFVRFVAVAVLALIPAAASAAPDSFLSPLGPVAEAQRHHLIRVVFITMIAIVPVLVGVPLILWRYRYRSGGTNDASGVLYRPDWKFSAPLEVVMWGIPLAIIIALSWWLWKETDDFDPYRALGPDPLEVQAIGLDWKWLFLYPDQGFATLDKLVIPAGRPVRIALTSDTVMQSFRVSALGGQIYAMPGMRTEINLMASRPGSARGENTQFNGAGFEHQNFEVRALTPDAWQAWAQQPSALTLDDRTYGRIAKAATGAQTLEMLGGDDGQARFSLVTGDVFNGVISRYHHGEAVPPAAQPGAPAYQGGKDD